MKLILKLAFALSGLLLLASPLSAQTTTNPEEGDNSATPATPAAPSAPSEEPSVGEPSVGVDAEIFTHWFAGYDAKVTAFKYGDYTIGWVCYNSNGIGATLSASANYGLVDPGNLTFRFGPVYGYALDRHVMFGSKLCGLISTYDSGGELKCGGGISMIPHITLRAESNLMLTVGYELGWIKLGEDSGFFHNLQLSIGYRF